jgi:23S rRNA pseudouridine2604 synthase
MASQILVRLNKLVAQKGMCSRREADVFIAKNLVRVDGKIINELGTKVRPNATIKLLPKAAAVIEKQGTILFNKPLGIVSCQPEVHQTPAIQLCTAENEYSMRRARRERRRQLAQLDIVDMKNDEKTSDRSSREPRRQPGWAAAGRLDINSTGLLVLTQSGVVAKQIIGSSMEKEYLVRVHADLLKDDMEIADKLRQLRQGITHEGERLTAKTVNVLNESQLQIVLDEGKKHHLRRMLQHVELKVGALKRVRIGNIVLGDLPVGKWRWLRSNETF